MDVGKMAATRKTVATSVIDCACDLLRLIVDRGFYAAYPNG